MANAKGNMKENAKLSLVDKLFNPRLINSKKVSMKEIADIANTSRPTVYRWLELIGLGKDSETSFDRELASEILGDTLTYNQFITLDNWSKKMRYDRMTDEELNSQRAYRHLERPEGYQATKKKNKTHEAEFASKNEKLMASLGVDAKPDLDDQKYTDDQTAETNAPKTTKEAPKISFAAYLKRWADSHELTKVSMVERALLTEELKFNGFDDVEEMYWKMVNQHEVNSIQWAFNRKFGALNSGRKKKLMSLIEHPDPIEIDKSNERVQFLYGCYVSNKEHIDLNRLGDKFSLVKHETTKEEPTPDQAQPVTPEETTTPAE